MRWLASNWLFVLVVVGMVWMHLRHGGHAGHEKPRIPAPTPGDDRVGTTTTAPTEAV